LARADIHACQVCIRLQVDTNEIRDNAAVAKPSGGLLEVGFAVGPELGGADGFGFMVQRHAGVVEGVSEHV